MKKVISILMVFSIMLCFVACGKEEVPAGYVMYSEIKGLSFLAPEEVVSKGPDNELFNEIFEDAANGEKVELSGTYLLEDELEFGYMTEDGLLILIAPNEGLMNLQSVYDNGHIGSYVEEVFPVSNVSSNAKTITNLKETVLSAPVKASAPMFGKMTGYFVGVEMGFDNTNILVLATEGYIEKNGENTEDLLKEIAKSLSFAE